jgi:hypothetical protein
MTARSIGDRLAGLLPHVVRAPSSHNTQPWRFRLRGETLELWADRTRGLPVNDPYDRELTISCGAALLTLRLTALAHSLAVTVEELPEGDTDLLARVRVTGTASADARETRLFDAVDERVTTRFAFREEPLDPRVADAVARAAEHAGVELATLEGEAREAFALLVAEGDRQQFHDQSWRRELASWMHPLRRGDGLPTRELTGPLTRLVVSHADVGRRTARRDETLAREAPLVCALATAGDEPGDWLAAGQGLQRVLLRAAAEGVQAGYLNQPIQVPSLRPHVREVSGLTGIPQVAFRLGVPAGELVPSARRPVEDVLERT